MTNRQFALHMQNNFDTNATVFVADGYTCFQLPTGGALVTEIDLEGKQYRVGVCTDEGEFIWDTPRQDKESLYQWLRERLLRRCPEEPAVGIKKWSEMRLDYEQLSCLLLRLRGGEPQRVETLSHEEVTKESLLPCGVGDDDYAWVFHVPAGTREIRETCFHASDEMPEIGAEIGDNLFVIQDHDPAGPLGSFGVFTSLFEVR